MNSEVEFLECFSYVFDVGKVKVVLIFVDEFVKNIDKWFKEWRVIMVEGKSVLEILLMSIVLVEKFGGICGFVLFVGFVIFLFVLRRRG